jgi:hypothetical protein
MNRYSGKCLCGSCCYLITGEKPKFMYLCHCSRCRKETGSSYGASIFFDSAQVTWQKGKINVRHFKLEGTRKERAFCNICGTPLPWQNELGQTVLPAGTLDLEDSFVVPTAHIFYTSRALWEDKVTNIKCFDEAPE